MDDTWSYESELLQWFDRYVMNEIPIRFIRLSDMKFVGRSGIRKHFRDSVPDYKLYYKPADTFKYAILSHRWMDEGEPTYEEMKSGIAAGPGYEKLKKFCKEARDYDVEFVWSDTCCIDKSSSTELDESIRSMYRWYANSEICIIHLAQSETIEDIRDDEWTQRGWTLQELLAPRKIKVFNKHWMPMTDSINDKIWEHTEMMIALETATGIPFDTLCHFKPCVFRVDEQMVWAARRKTTRVEDVAYSLMGIFNISLQIAYGEGGERAFRRLIEAILQSGDPSVLNWKGQSTVYYGAFPKSPRNYEGQIPLRSSGRLEMTMTSLGLRVPLVVLPLSVSSSSARSFKVAEGVWEATLECPLCPAVKISFIDHGDDTNNKYFHFAFGIVNYSLGSRDVPRIPGKSVGFILHREPESFHAPSIAICEPRAEDLAGLKTVSRSKREFVPWKKYDTTGLVDINFPNIPSSSFFYISREYLKIVYL